MLQGILTALITPFLPDHSIDWEGFGQLIERQIEAKVSALVLLGTTGEAPTIRSDEFPNILSFAAKRIKGRVPLIVGCGTNATHTTCEKITLAKKLGADGALVVVPYYNLPSDEGVLFHFEEATKQHLPIIAYHHPGRTGKKLKGETLVSLSHMEGIVAIKEVTSNLKELSSLVEKSPIPILSGVDDLFLSQLEVGVAGSISVVANLFPKEWIDLFTLFSSDRALALEKMERLVPLLEILAKEGNPVAIKSALAAANLIQSSAVRAPLLPASENLKKQLSSLLHEESLLSQ